MKKKQLEVLEKINEERKLNKDTKIKIQKRVLKNFLFASGILLFFIILMLIQRNLEKQVAMFIYKTASVVVFTFTLVLFEFAYKKDNDNLAITSIEFLFLSIATLLTPYTFINRQNVFSLLIGTYFTIYYLVKNFIVYRKEKNEYLKEKNDINQIVKKESKDELAQEHLEKIKLEKETKTMKKKNKTSKKITKTTIKKKTKTSMKKEPTGDVVPKRKRGRPRKFKIEE